MKPTFLDRIIRLAGSMTLLLMLLVACTSIDAAQGPTVGSEATGGAEVVEQQAADEDGQKINNPNLIHISMQDNLQGWGLSDSEVLRTDDGGLTWVTVTPGDFNVRGQKAAAYFLDIQTGWVLAPDVPDGGAGVLYMTQDGGRSWQNSPTPFGSGELEFIDLTHGYALSDGNPEDASGYKEIYKTSNGGMSWELVHRVGSGSADGTLKLPVEGIINGMTFRDLDTGWITGQAVQNGVSFLFITKDGGSTWQHQELTLPDEINNDLISVQAPVFFNETYGKLPVYFVSDPTGFLLYSSLDGGETWSDTTLVSINGKVDVISMQTAVIWDGKEVGMTRDGGTTWGMVETGLNISDSLVQIDFVNQLEGWALALQPGGSNLYKTQDGGVLWEQLRP